MVKRKCSTANKLPIQHKKSKPTIGAKKICIETGKKYKHNGSRWIEVCRDCGDREPTYGIVQNKKRLSLWCKRCAEENHPSDYIDHNKKCEDCKKLRPHLEP